MGMVLADALLFLQSLFGGGVRCGLALPIGDSLVQLRHQVVHARKLAFAGRRLGQFADKPARLGERRLTQIEP